MPSSYPQFTKCAAPGDARPSSDLTGWIPSLIVSAIFGGTIAFVSTLIFEAVLGEVLLLGCVLGLGFIPFAIAGVQEFKNWYYNQRLMCIHKDRCVVGTLASNTKNLTDGDLKFNLLVAPSTQESVQNNFKEILAAFDDFDAGPGSGYDELDYDDIDKIRGYIKNQLSPSQRDRLYISVVHGRQIPQEDGTEKSVGMFVDPEKSFQKHFYVRDRDIMGDEAFSNSPPDTYEEAEPDDPNVVFVAEPGVALEPHLHTELEGNKLERWLDNVVVGLWTFFFAFAAACVICEVYTFGIADWACGVIGGVIAFILGVLGWAIADAFNDPEDGNAGQEDVDFNDPASNGDSATIVPGDALVIFGDWVMDPEHNVRFEIHPIKAIYLLCRSAVDPDNPDRWDVVRDLTNYPRETLCPFPVENVTSDDWEEMCKLIDPKETSDPDDVIVLKVEESLSMMTGLRPKPEPAVAL